MMHRFVFAKCDGKPQSSTRTLIGAVFMLISAGLMIAMLTGLISIYGFPVIFNNIPLVSFASSVLGIVGIVLLVLGIVDLVRFRRLGHCKTTAWAKVVILIGIVSTSTLYGIAWISPTIQYDDSPPILFTINQQGAYGLPNYGLIWWTENPMVAKVFWGDGVRIATVTDPVARQNHAFVLGDVMPNTTYWYQINDGLLRNFTTPSLDRLRFALGGDLHFGATNPIAITTLLDHIVNATDPYHTVFLLGDFVDYGYNDVQWKLGLSTIASYSQYVPFRPIVGNHDTIFGGLGFYEDYFYPSTLPSDTNALIYYRLDYGNDVHILCLHLEWGMESFTEDQIVLFPNAMHLTRSLHHYG